jgi:hypothetical protein
MVPVRLSRLPYIATLTVRGHLHVERVQCARAESGGFGRPLLSVPNFQSGVWCSLRANLVWASPCLIR